MLKTMQKKYITKHKKISIIATQNAVVTFKMAVYSTEILANPGLYSA